MFALLLLSYFPIFPIPILSISSDFLTSAGRLIIAGFRFCFFYTQSSIGSGQPTSWLRSVQCRPARRVLEFIRHTGLQRARPASPLPRPPLDPAYQLISLKIFSPRNPSQAGRTSSSANLIVVLVVVISDNGHQIQWLCDSSEPDIGLSEHSDSLSGHGQTSTYLSGESHAFEIDFVSVHTQTLSIFPFAPQFALVCPSCLIANSLSFTASP